MHYIYFARYPRDFQTFSFSMEIDPFSLPGFIRELILLVCRDL